MTGRAPSTDQIRKRDRQRQTSTRSSTVNPLEAIEAWRVPFGAAAAHGADPVDLAPLHAKNISCLTASFPCWLGSLPAPKDEEGKAR